MGLLALALPALLTLAAHVHSQAELNSYYNGIRRLPYPFAKAGLLTAPSPVELPGWGTGLEAILGQITGVSVDSAGRPHLFHRGPRVWHANSFNRSHHLQTEEPIDVDVVVVLEPEAGEVVGSWGAGLFYLPHGITVDHRDNVWLTDVGMHQVLKFSSGWMGNSPTLRLGEFFNPGSGKTQFCQPTSVAVASSDDIFVADGYCNRRVMKFDRLGHLTRIFPQNDEFVSLMVPHSVALVEERDLLCLADRENMRVACLRAELRPTRAANGSSNAPLTIHQPDFGRVFAVASHKGYVYAVNGPTSPMIPLQGFTIDPVSELVIDHWGPVTQPFTSPHSVGISPEGDSLYVSEIGPNRLWKFQLEPTNPAYLLKTLFNFQNN